MNEEIETYKPTLGEQLIGISYNPTFPAVNEAQKLLSRAADLLFEDFNNRLKEGTLSHQSLYATLHNHALGQILNAQMNIVKVITFK